mmetsp:Transcript_14576/g.43288  ORF Transcript_14576/g.43288 Transcript_14576/m.43288 type:complete len:211 (-) Transcript_14576:64-696(-)
MLHRERLDLRADDAGALEGVRLGVVLEDDPVVVVHVVHPRACPRDRLGAPEAQREAALVDGDDAGRAAAEGGLDDSGRRGEVVDDPVDPVVLANLGGEKRRLLRVVRLLAEQLARDLHVHLDRVRGVLDAVSAHHLAKVFALVNNLGWPTEWQVVPLVGQVRLGGRQLVDLQIDGLAVAVIDRRHTGEIEGGRGNHEQQESAACSEQHSQ